MSSTAYFQHVPGVGGEVVSVLTIEVALGLGTLAHVTLTATIYGVSVLIFRPSAELLASLRQALDDCQRPMGAMTAQGQ